MFEEVLFPDGCFDEELFFWSWLSRRPYGLGLEFLVGQSRMRWLEELQLKQRRTPYWRLLLWLRLEIWLRDSVGIAPNGELCVFLCLRTDAIFSA